MSVRVLTLRTWDVGTKTVGTFWGVPWYSDRLPMTIVARRTLASAHLHVLLNSYGTVGGQAMLIIAAPTRSSYGTGFVWQSLALRVLRLSELQSLRSMLVVRPNILAGPGTGWPSSCVRESSSHPLLSTLQLQR